MTIEDRGDAFHIRFPFSTRLLQAVKELPGRYWNGTLKVWVVPCLYEAEVKAFGAKHRFTFGEPSPEANQNFVIPELPELTVAIPLKEKLFPYQAKGVAYSIQKQRTFIADEPGLGKTAQAIAAVLHANVFPCLVICPSSLKINWQREWEKWTNKKARVIDPAVARYMDRWVDTGMIDVFIVNYESLKKYFVQEINKPEGGKLTIKNIVFNRKRDLFKSVIVDESHRCKDLKTQQTKFVKGIADNKEWIFLLSGTPVVNKPKDLIPQLGILNRMNDFGGYKFFVDRYCGGFTGASNLKELNYKLNTICFYRREKKDVLKDLPAKVRQLIMCEIDEAHRREYQKAEEDLREYLIKYRQATDEKVESALKGEVMVRIGILKNISARGKLNDVKEFIQETLDSGQKLIVFIHLKEVFDKLMSMFPHAVSVVGSNTATERDNAVKRFQTDPECKLIILSDAGKEGLTLTAATRVAFVEWGWNPANTDQKEDRAHRIGQKDSVHCIYFMGKDTIDEWTYQIIQDKRKVNTEITGDEDVVTVDVVDRFATLFNIPEAQKVEA